jgi:hypothetical protein
MVIVVNFIFKNGTAIFFNLITSYYYFRSYFKVIKPLKSDDYPIGVKIDFYKSIGEGNWDIDNHAIFYRKTIMDSLKGVIEDDSVKYVRSIPCNYYDCLDKDKKIIVTIFKLNANV